MKGEMEIELEMHIRAEADIPVTRKTMAWRLTDAASNGVGDE